LSGIFGSTSHVGEEIVEDHPLVEITQKFAWVVGPLYDKNDSKRPIGFRAVKGWHVINLDDDAENAVTLKATTPQELLDKVKAFEAEQTKNMEEAKK
jgi:hypothetical protein